MANKFINPDGSISTLNEISGGSGVDIVQEIGESKTAVMSQKAVTNTLFSESSAGNYRVKINSTTPIDKPETEKVVLINSDSSNTIRGESVVIGGAPAATGNTNSELVAVGNNALAAKYCVAVALFCWSNFA